MMLADKGNLIGMPPHHPEILDAGFITIYRTGGRKDVVTIANAAV